ncbi:MAG: hypothetical protein ACR2PL_13160 [Dehalococcoidia bacterium]
MALALLDYVLGDRAGASLLGSSLLVITLATIAAIIDIPLHNLEEAGLLQTIGRAPLLPPQAFLLGGLPAAALTFTAAAVAAYSSSMQQHGSELNWLMFLALNGGFAFAILLWVLASPLTRHWGLGLASFGLGLGLLFPLLGSVLRLHFEAGGILPNQPDRVIFALSVGGIVCSLGCCLVSILSLALYVVRQSGYLVKEYRRRSHGLPRSREVAAAVPALVAVEPPSRPRAAPKSRSRRREQ